MDLTKPQRQEYAKKIGIDYQDWELNLHTIEEHYSYNDIKKITDKWCEASCSLFRKESTKQSKKELIEMILFLSESLRNKRDYLQTALQKAYDTTKIALKNGEAAEKYLGKISRRDLSIKRLKEDNFIMKRNYEPLKAFLKEYKMWDSYLSEKMLTDNNE
jgi:hypothetical protein